MNNNTRKVYRSGFSLIELLIILFVIAIITAIANTKLTSSASLTLHQQSERFVNQIRHAQFLAINWGCQLALTVSTTNYTLRSNVDYSSVGKSECGNNNIVTDPSTGSAFSIDLESDVSFSVTGVLYIDSYGRPLNSDTSFATSNKSYVLSGGNDTYQVDILPLTGLVVPQ